MTRRIVPLSLLSIAGCFIGAEDVPPPASPGPQGRYGSAVAFDTSRGRMVVYGGLSNVGVQTSTWVFGDGQWSELSTAGPPALDRPAMAYDPRRDRIVLFGGTPLDPEAPCGATWELVDDRWRRVDVEGPPCRSGHSMTYDSEAQRIVLFGGRVDGGCSDGSCQQTWAYDGAWILLHAPEPGE